MRHAFPVLAAALLCLLPTMAFQFTEVMYDPPGSDNNLEFLELAGAPNLSGWIVGDLASNDTLLPLSINASSDRSLIVEEGYAYANLSCNIYSAGATIGNNLNNGGDALFLAAPNGSLLLNFSYDGGLGSNNGLSLSLLNGSWREAPPSPCLPNNYNIENNSAPDASGNASTAIDLSLAPLLSGRIYATVPYDSLFLVRNEQYESGRSEPLAATIAYNLTRNGSLLFAREFTLTVKSHKTAGTGHLLLDETGNYTLCGRILWTNITDRHPENDQACQALTVADPYAEPCNVTLALELEEPKLYYEAGESIAFRNRIERQDNGTLPPFSIRYWVETLDGETVRSTLTENANRKRWTPKPAGPVVVYLLKNRLELLACNNTNAPQGGTALLVVTGEPEASPENRSSIDIEEVSIPQRVGQGDTIKVSARLYKGDTRKYSVTLSLRDARNRILASTTMHVRQRFTEHEVTLPLVLRRTPGTGSHRITLEGLGDRATEQVWLAGKEEAKTGNRTPAAEAAPLSIVSFYTRSRKAQESINLYATITGDGKATVELLGLDDHNTTLVTLTPPATFTLAQRASMRPGANIFLLKLKDEAGRLRCTKELLLEMDDEIRQVERFTKRPPPSRNGTPAAVAEPKQEEGLLTGSVAYEADRTTEALPVLLGLSGALLLGIILRRSAA